MDWEDILKRARKKERYLGQIITRDTPIFNVDYLSAFAYAKWKDRRLPKKEEWLLAASGKKALPYPWGVEAQNPHINLACNADPKNVTDPTYFHVLLAESNSHDIGPYGHFDMGGNLSEWINSLEVNKSGDAPPPFIGGNYLDQAAVANSNAVRLLPSDKGDPRIGFRTAR
jgi:formylglycine-generating enzyme required for sulfatase activity